MRPFVRCIRTAPRRNILGLDVLAQYSPPLDRPIENAPLDNVSTEPVTASKSSTLENVPTESVAALNSSALDDAPTESVTAAKSSELLPDRPLFASLAGSRIQLNSRPELQWNMQKHTRYKNMTEFIAPLQQVAEKRQSHNIEDLALADSLPRVKTLVPLRKEKITSAEPEWLANIATVDKQKTFAEMKLPTWLVNSLTGLSITQPTLVQQKVIESMLDVKDGQKLRPILVKGQTGSGKSLGYIIALLAGLHKESLVKDLTNIASCFHLIVVPNAILAYQLLRWIRVLTQENAYLNENLTNVVRLLLPESEIDQLDETFSPEITKHGRSHILIAMPSVVRNALATGHLNVSTIKSIIVDEADALMKPLSAYATLKERLNRVRHPVPALSLLKELQSTCQEHGLFQPRMVLLSASLNGRCRDDLQKTGLLTGAYTLVGETGKTPTCPSTIKHYYRMLSDSDSVEELIQLIRWIWIERKGETGVLFIPSAKSKEAMKDLLQASGINAQIMSDLPSGDQAALDKLTSEGDALFLGSDVDARGWDMPNLKYVLVVDLPSSPTHYLHMAGRVGRMGAIGSVYTLVAGNRDLERLTNIYSMLRLRATPYIPSE